MPEWMCQKCGEVLYAEDYESLVELIEKHTETHTKGLMDKIKAFFSKKKELENSL